MPLGKAKSAWSGYYITLGRSDDVMCVATKADIDNAIDWNTGDPILVKGRISDVTFGTLILKDCSFSKAPR
jgi:hypothetical protein